MFQYGRVPFGLRCYEQKSLWQNLILEHLCECQTTTYRLLLVEITLTLLILLGKATVGVTMHSFEKTIHGRFSSGESAISAVVEHLWRFVSNGFFSADTQRKVRDYPYFETTKTVKKISRLKRGVYRAIGIGRQSRPLGQNKGFFFLQIRGRSRRRNYARESASICARKPAHGAGQA